MTRPGRCSSSTFAIRACSHRNRRGREAPRRPVPRRQRAHQAPEGHPPSAFSLSGGSSISLATKDPSDVGSLSRPVMLQPVSAPLQRGIRFFRHLKPAHRSTRLAASPPADAEASTGGVRGFHVPLMKYVRVGTCCRPVRFVIHEAVPLKPLSVPRCLLA